MKIEGMLENNLVDRVQIVMSRLREENALEAFFEYIFDTTIENHQEKKYVRILQEMSYDMQKEMYLDSIKNMTLEQLKEQAWKDAYDGLWGLGERSGSELTEYFNFNVSRQKSYDYVIVTMRKALNQYLKKISENKESILKDSIQSTKERIERMEKDLEEQRNNLDNQISSLKEFQCN